MTVEHGTARVAVLGDPRRSGELRWLGITRPRGRTELERATVWTLIPRTREFIANWFVGEAWSTEDSGLVFENVDSEYARTGASKSRSPHLTTWPGSRTRSGC